MFSIQKASRGTARINNNEEKSESCKDILVSQMVSLVKKMILKVIAAKLYTLIFKYTEVDLGLAY